ncbi:MAG: hypothetical protein ABI700_10520, partial [Chloroflexota bacterium]
KCSPPNQNTRTILLITKKGDAMFTTDRSEEVYQCIWNYVTEREALPTNAQIAHALDMPKYEISGCVRVLRDAKRIEPTILLPTAYCAWWREHVRANWSYKALRASRA